MTDTTTAPGSATNGAANPLRGRFFITGTDTEIGKTWVSCRLLEHAQQQGLSCYGLKPIAAGCEQYDGQWQNEDARALMATSSVTLHYDEVNPVALRAAIAPHLAAAEESRQLSAERLAGYLRGTLDKYPADLVLIEGAGGWRVPLNLREPLSALPKLLSLPVILVVGMRLGCINHALLTAEAITRDGMTLAGWVANDLGAPMPQLAENIATLDKLMPAPRITLTDSRPH